MGIELYKCTQAAMNLAKKNYEVVEIFNPRRKKNAQFLILKDILKLKGDIGDFDSKEYPTRAYGGAYSFFTHCYFQETAKQLKKEFDSFTYCSNKTIDPTFTMGVDGNDLIHLLGTYNEINGLKTKLSEYEKQSGGEKIYYPPRNIVGDLLKKMGKKITLEKGKVM